MSTSTDHRSRILASATALLAQGGLEAVTTRSVSAAAGVQPPTIYRLFGDMGGLLDDVVREGFTRYLEEKSRASGSGDALADLRRGWALHVGFGLSHPTHYRLMYGMGGASRLHAVRAEADRMLASLVDAVAAEGRLRVEPALAAAMIHAAGVGVALQLIDAGETDADAPLSLAVRDAVFARLTTEESSPEKGRARSAIALRAALGREAHDLSTGEWALLDELLIRLGR